MLFPEDVWIVIRDLKRHKPLRVALDAILAHTWLSVPRPGVYRPSRTVFRSGAHCWVIWGDLNPVKKQYRFRKVNRYREMKGGTRFVNAVGDFWTWTWSTSSA